MGYTRKWIPPTLPLRDNLAAWKTLFFDLHQNLLDAGLKSTDTAGQLDAGSALSPFPGVTTLPADGGFAGFVEYAFDDALQGTAPVVIKIEYGCGIEGLYSGGGGCCRPRTPRVRATVKFAGATGLPFGCPQGYSGSGGLTTNGAAIGWSAITYSKDLGFFGVAYGSGSRCRDITNVEGLYIGATFSLFVQRAAGSDGAPTIEGVATYFNGLDGYQNMAYLWGNGILNPSYSQYISSAGPQPACRNLARRIGDNDNSIIGGEIQTQQVFYSDPKLKPFPWLVSYATGVAEAPDIPEGNEFSIEVFPGTESNFIALGNKTSMSLDSVLGQRAGLAMLFE